MKINHILNDTQYTSIANLIFDLLEEDIAVQFKPKYGSALEISLTDCKRNKRISHIESVTSMAASKNSNMLVELILQLRGELLNATRK